MGIVFFADKQMMMKRKMEQNRLAGKMTQGEFFLPSPDELAMPDEAVKVTITLKKSSVEFFKHEADRHHTKYQRMIRELLDKYVSRYRTA